MSRWERKVRRIFPRSVWVDGDGPFALLCPCRDLSITLWPTEAKADEAMERVNATGCGGGCSLETREDHHLIVNLNEPETRLREIKAARLGWFYRR